MHEHERVVPSLLLDSGRVVKTRAYGSRTRYLGDLQNLLRIYTDKFVDEIIICDRTANRCGIDVGALAAASAEFFAPITYGGGIKTTSDGVQAVAAGVEKVLVTSAAPLPGIIEELAAELGVQSVVGGVDVVRHRGRLRCATEGARRVLPGTIVERVVRLVDRGVGEILLNVTFREGTRKGYDLALLRRVVDACPVPVTVLGGAGTPAHLRAGLDAGASAVAAGTMFSFLGPRQAVLPTYLPLRDDGTIDWRAAL
jgi:cyclase